MDNVTHTLIGVVAAGALKRRQPDVAPQALLWASVIASNFGDIDILIRSLGGDGKMDYLLHHRGFTHTALFLPLVVALSTPLGALVGAGSRGVRALKARDWRWIFLAALAGGFFHVFADFWNSYGVHPFSPFWDRWFYGDFIFILEPLLWFSLIPFAFREARTRAGRIALGILGIAMLALAWTSQLTGPWVAGALTVWVAAITFLQKRVGGVIPPVTAVALVLLAFALGSHEVRTRVKEEYRESAPSERLSDLETTPAPGNPLCWRLIAVSEDPAGAYIARVGSASLLTDFFPPDRCFARLGTAGTAPLQASTLPGRDWLHWRGEFRATWVELDGLAKEHCRVRALLGFVRMPFWLRAPESKGWIVGDLRFDREPGLGFTEELISDAPAERDRCPGYWPSWEMPVYRHRR
ncbi:MAG: metal-dependent hydrolase [Oligoflexia bacterium]|nr:metal-dependent hydrolase [Oligoflexia bacterium]